MNAVSLVYDHHTRDLSEKLTEHQHSHHKEIISALHVHLDAHRCLEAVVLKGKVKNDQETGRGIDRYQGCQV